MEFAHEQITEIIFKITTDETGFQDLIKGGCCLYKEPVFSFLYFYFYANQ